uniref:Uncharacterized protein n=1 Tax=Arundo donax TaxID=35708 RepID=A0A0A9FWM2_ARUDO
MKNCGHLLTSKIQMKPLQDPNLDLVLMHV